MWIFCLPNCYFWGLRQTETTDLGDRCIYKILCSIFQDDVTFDNLYGSGSTSSLIGGEDIIVDMDVITGSTSTASLDAPKPVRGERLRFGDCHVGVAGVRSFSVTNHSDVDTVRFQVKC